MAASTKSVSDETADLSKQSLKKLNRPSSGDALHIKTLILDDNELQRWDNIECYPNISSLSASNNLILRLYGISKLHNLISLTLDHNNVLTIEGLKDLVNLKRLSLAHNNIKNIEHLNSNINLEYLNLSENSITQLSDLSFLKNLKEFHLHGNCISQLRNAEKHLPTSIEIFTLANNLIADLIEISHLAHLTHLHEITLQNNPCIDMTGSKCIGFDFRPFVINWCMSLKVIDGFAVDALESLKAEWLYSQGRGRQFRAGEHRALAQYLAVVCPLSGDSLESDNERKLRVVLSKARQHQEQLASQPSVSIAPPNTTNIPEGSPKPPRPSSAAASFMRSQSSPASSRRKLQTSGSPQPRRSALPARTDRLTSSLHGTVGNSSGIMSRSLDASLMCNNNNIINKIQNNNSGNSSQNDEQDFNTNEIQSMPIASGALQAASKLVPVPESLMSPDYRILPSVVNSGSPATISSLQASINSSPKPSRSSLTNGHSAIARVTKSRTGALVAPRPIKPRKCHSQSTINNSTNSSLNLATNIIPSSEDDDDDSEMSASKLRTIKDRASDKKRQQEATTIADNSKSPLNKKANPEALTLAAICIQKYWRGFRTRRLNPQVQDTYIDLNWSRTKQYIERLTSDMVIAKESLSTEQRLHALQLRAIDALWTRLGELTSLSAQQAQPPPPPPPPAEEVVLLRNTCERLHSQMIQLQDSMSGIMQRLAELSTSNSINTSAPTAGTQTDIIAVITPLQENFPYGSVVSSAPRRPSTLNILPDASVANEEEPTQKFAGSVAEGVLRSLASEKESDVQENEESKITDLPIPEKDKNVIAPNNNILDSGVESEDKIEEKSID